MHDIAEFQGLLPGQAFALELEAEGITPLPDEARMALLGLTEIFATKEEVRDTCLRMALEIVRDERRLQQENPETYRAPVVISLLNGAVPFTAMLLEYASDYGLELDPIYVNPSAYGVEKTAGKTEISKDFTPEELARMSGRRLLILDEVLETSGTLLTTIDYLKSRLSGSVWVNRQNGDGKHVKVEVELEQPESFEIAVLWTKEPEEMFVDKPKYIGAVCPKKWITGSGCDDKDPVTGDGVGRFAILGGISKNQPEA